MDEEKQNDENNQNKENVKKAAEEVKGETINTFNQVKDTMKNTDFKEEAKNTKGFLLELMSDPIGLISSVAKGERSILKTGLFLMVVTIAINIIESVIRVFRYSGFHFMTFVRDITYPVVYVFLFAVIILLLNKNNKKSLLTILEVILIAYIPTIINNAIGLVTTIVYNSTLSSIVGCLTGAIALVGTVLKYFGTKELFGEEDTSKMIRTFFVVMLIHQIGMFVIGLTNLI